MDAQAAEQYLKVYLDYDLQRKKLQFEREKFQLACALAREGQMVDEAKKEVAPANDAACDPKSSLDDNQVQLSSMDSDDDEQIVA